jgi:DNA polymerase-3 subunit delta'
MFEHLIGNEKVKESLTHLLRSGRLPNSLLFAGPEGVGKKGFAVELARTFVCQHPSDGLACGKCAACARVGQFHVATSEKGEDYEAVFFGEHPDVGIVIPFKRNLRVGSIRALEREANYRPFEARGRVFILDDADKMNDSASNALLKTLEEPSETTYIILLTSRPDTLLSTIRSRCQTIRFAPVAESEIENVLVKERKLKAVDAKLAARVTNGSVGAAMTLDVDEYRSRRTFQMSVLEKAFVNADRPALLRSAEQMNDAKNKVLYEENLSILESLVRDMWMLKNGVSKDAIKNFDDAEKLNDIAFQVDQKQLHLALAEIESLRQSFAVNINRKPSTDALFMKISA